MHREHFFISISSIYAKSINIPFDVDYMDTFYFGEKSIQLAWAGVHENPVILYGERNISIGLGFFYCSNVSSKEEILKELFERGNVTPAEINGEFLLLSIDKEDGSLVIYSDRFSSIQFHYSENSNGFIGAFSFSDIVVSKKAEKETLTWGDEEFYEYLNYRRIHGKYTLCKEIFFLRSGHLLRYTDRMFVERYFAPKYEQRKISHNTAAVWVAEALQASISDKVSDAQSISLFLSGGHDTRVVLAALNRDVRCYTVGFNAQTREILRARELCDLIGVEHIPVVLEPDLYQETYLEAVLQNGGHYNVANIFLGLRDRVDAESVGLCGTGLDYLFQGMYIPRNDVNFHDYTLFHTPQTISSDISNFYLSSFSSRIKFPNINMLFRSDSIEDMRLALLHKIKYLEEEALEFGANPLQAYHHLFLSDPSRHYSYPDNLAMRTLCKLRTPSFDNRVFDCYLQTDPLLRFDRRLVRDVLDILKPEFRRVLSANDDLPIVSSSRKLAYRALRKFRTSLFGKPEEKPMETVRTWPTNDTALKTTRQAQQAIEILLDSQNSGNLIDIVRLADLYRRWQHEPADCPNHTADILWNIASVQMFKQYLGGS
ncbi:asparagine synthase-related protein [Thalassospira alkalitolerans]|uniref:asparagine synthase-related protein n=1 Tax=Thalassospira alkalitolerans TaxID=1293890 RepID=UPI0030EC60CF|tara:strand:- start:21731 stop:23530 length:1800 start_codon:yes stop_codon:yes gene_type:complete